MTGESGEITGIRPSLISRARPAGEVKREVNEADFLAGVKSTMEVVGPEVSRVPRRERGGKVHRTG